MKWWHVLSWSTELQSDHYLILMLFSIDFAKEKTYKKGVEELNYK